MSYYDRQGRPLPDLLIDREGFLREVAPLTRDDDYKRVALTEIGDIRISTVWLGLDHNFNPTGPPLIFETMVFGGPLNEEQWRYPTEAAALAGHDQAVAAVHEALRGDAK
jgi:hypothetical protein